MVKLIGYLLALMLALVAIPMFCFAALGLSMSSAVTNSETVMDVLDNQSLYGELIPYLLPAVVDVANIDTAPVSLNAVSDSLQSSGWRLVANELIPPNWVHEQVEVVIDGIFQIINGDATALDTTIDFSPVIERLTGDTGTTVAQLIIDNAPSCTDDDIALIEKYAVGEEGLPPLPICQPPERLQQTSVDLIAGAMARIGRQLSQDDLQFDTLFSSVDDSGIRVIGLIFEIAGQLIMLMYLCPAGLLALIVVAAVRSWRSFGRWMGVTVLVTGFLMVIVLFFLQLLVIESFSEILTATSDVERLQLQITASFTRSVFSQMSTPLLLQAALFIGLGLVLLSVAFVAGRRSSGGDAMFILTEDGQVISTATGQRQGTVVLTPPPDTPRRA